MADRTPEEIELHQTIFEKTLSMSEVELAEVQMVKLEMACWKAIDENEQMTVHEYLIATKIYLNLIIDFPDLSF